jgi:hypothetical protein
MSFIISDVLETCSLVVELLSLVMVAVCECVSWLHVGMCDCDCGEKAVTDALFSRKTASEYDLQLVAIVACL